MLRCRSFCPLRLHYWSRLSAPSPVGPTDGTYDERGELLYLSQFPPLPDLADLDGLIEKKPTNRVRKPEQLLKPEFCRH